MPGRGDRGRRKERPKDTKKALRRLLSYLKPFLLPVFFSCLCAFIGNILNEEKGLDKKFYGAVDKIEDVRKRLISARIEKVVSSMNHLYKIAISRVKRFTGRNAGRMNDMLGTIKRRLKKEEENER